MGTAESSTVATETENQNPSELLQKHASVFLCASHTHSHTRRSFEVEFCTYENGNNVKITKKNHFKKKKKIKNLYTLHVLIKVTEPVRILDSSCI